MTTTTRRPAKHLNVADTDTVTLPDGTTRVLLQVSDYAVGLLLLTWADRSTTIASPTDLFDVA